MEWTRSLEVFSKIPKFLSYNSCIIFSTETEKENISSFHDVEVICQQGKIKATIYREPNFGGVFNNFESFILSVYEFGMLSF